MSKQWSYEEKLESVKYKGNYKGDNITIKCVDVGFFWKCFIEVQDTKTKAVEKFDRTYDNKGLNEIVERFNLKKVSK